MQKTSHESIRLFKNDHLERLTKVHPVTPLVIFVPVLFWMYSKSVQFGITKDVAVAYGLAGLIAFTLLEYTIHRFLFHFKPIGPRTERLIYLFHGIHHEDPHDPFRLVMPPTVSISLSLLMYFVFAAAIQPAVLPAFFFGFILGYLIYDMGHYAFHHLKWKNPVFKYLRKYHYLHHFSDSDRGYGVSSPLWDYVFQTQCVQEENQSRAVASDH